MTIRLVPQGDRLYVSEDGRVEVSRDDTFETECDEPHPVKMRLDALRAQYANDAAGQRGFDAFVSNIKFLHGGRTFLKRTKSGIHEYLSWYCDGGELHRYSQWVSKIDDDWTEFVTDKFAQQIGELEALLGEKITVGRTRREKPSVSAQEPISAPSPEIAAEDMSVRELWADELRAIEGSLVRYDELMASDDAPFVDQKLHDFHLNRKAELERMLR